MSARDVWHFLRPFQGRAIGVAALALLDTILASLGVGIVLPVLQAVLDPSHTSSVMTRLFPAFDRLAPNDRLLALATATVALFAAKAVVSWASLVSSNRLLQRLRFYWVDRIGAYYLCGPFQRVAGRKQGELLNDWFNETLSAARFYQAYLAYASSAVLVTALVVLGFVVDWRVTLAFLALGAIASLIVRHTLYGRAATLSETKLRLNQAVSASMVEDLANLRDLKLMGAESRRLRALSDLTSRLGRTFTASAVTGELPRIASEVIAVALMMAMIVGGALFMRLPVETLLPAMVFFFVASYRIVSATTQVMGARVKALNEVQSLRHVREIVELAGEQEAVDRGERLQRIDTDIVLRHVDYAYIPNNAVIKDLSVVIRQGKTTLLVGPSGAGKSTLLDLLLRLIEPTGGSIEANGRRASDFRLADWRRTCGYVSQDVSLFNGSLRMNLLLARRDATEAELVEACRLAGAEEFVRTLPDGLDTVVGDRGYSLSGGQRKRIAIARALIGRPSVLVLDEATTSFEQSLEAEILRNLRAAVPNLTILHVTHRLSSIANADSVIELDNGRIVARGAQVKG